MSTKTESHDPFGFWEGRWQSGRTPWDHGRPAPPFEEFVERCGPPVGKVLIPGTGSGHDVRYFAGLGAEVTGLDISPTAVRVAQERNPHPRATYRQGDILHPPADLMARFDWVIEHTCLCALDPLHWPQYADSIARLLVPGGHYLALFYRNPHDDEGPPHRIDADQIEELFGPTFAQLQAWVPGRSYESRAGREELRLFRLAL